MVNIIKKNDQAGLLITIFEIWLQNSIKNSFIKIFCFELILEIINKNQHLFVIKFKRKYLLYTLTINCIIFAVEIRKVLIEVKIESHSLSQTAL